MKYSGIWSQMVSYEKGLLSAAFFLGGGDVVVVVYHFFWWESLQMNQTYKGMKTNFILFRGQKWMQNDGINEKRVFRVSRFKFSMSSFHLP